MKIYDISQELMGCVVYPGDKVPEKELVCDMKQGDLYNLTNISLCAHNGTHIDAPAHFIKEGKTVEEIDLEKFIGECIVVSFNGEINAEDAKKLAEQENFTKRILIKGEAYVTENSAKVFAEKGIYLLGCESQSVGPEASPMAVHKILLEKEVVLLEGLRLNNIDDGEYFLCAPPVNIAGSDGAPCRAVLIKF